MRSRLRSRTLSLAVITTALAITMSTAQPAFAQAEGDAPQPQLELEESSTPAADQATDDDGGEAPEAVPAEPSDPSAGDADAPAENSEAALPAPAEPAPPAEVDAGPTGEDVQADSAPLPQELAAVEPTIAGAFVIGKVLTALPGAWAEGTTFTYQWLRSGEPIAGATAVTYKLTSADGGETIAVSVTGSLNGATETRTSAETSVLRLLASTVPKFTGTVKVGNVLKMSAGTWTKDAKLHYRWLRDGAPIAGATKQSYKLTKKDAGKQIGVRMSGSKEGFQKVVKKGSSKRVPLVLKSPKPKISGTKVLGQTLTLTLGSWTPKTKLNYRWLRNGVPIKGATKTKYKLKPVDAGKRISVRVKGIKSGYASELRTSGQTGAIQRPAPIRYYQTDSRWANHQVGNWLMGWTGCVPTATSMALWSAGINANPYSVAQVMNQKGDYNHGVPGAGSRSIVAAGKHYGVKVSPIRSKAALHRGLQSGRTVVALVGGPASITFPGSTHAVTLRGLSQGATFVSNPYGSAVSAWYNTDTLWANQSYDPLDRAAGAVFWAIG